MPRPPRQRFAGFVPELAFEDPVHLRAAINELPALPGVYTFHGDDELLPLYIGKSVNLRARVLSHLRNADEARMLRQAKRISHIRTAGEIGALLLEAQMIKQLQPLMNQKLRRNRQLCSLLMGEGAAAPEVVYSNALNFATEPALYGLFSSRHAALDRLRELADEAKLCHGVLGLEKLSAGRACFRASLRQCAGACRGDEAPALHRARLLMALDALRVACWPHPGAVALIERDAVTGAVDHLVIRNWCYLGRANTVAEARQLDQVAAGFDADGYRILCRPLLSGEAEVLAL